MMGDWRRNGGHSNGYHGKGEDEEVPYQDFPLVIDTDTDLAHSKNPREMVGRFYNDGTSFVHHQVC